MNALAGNFYQGLLKKAVLDVFKAVEAKKSLTYPMKKLSTDIRIFYKLCGIFGKSEAQRFIERALVAAENLYPGIRIVIQKAYKGALELQIKVLDTERNSWKYYKVFLCLPSGAFYEHVA